jgi:hypothetical protein
VKRTKKELIKALEQKGIIASGKAADIKKLAKNNGILTVLQEQKRKKIGRVDQKVCFRYYGSKVGLMSGS